MRKISTKLCSLAVLSLACSALTSCSSNNPSDVGYWLTNAKYEYVSTEKATDDKAAGTYYSYKINAEAVDITFNLKSKANFTTIKCEMFLDGEQVADSNPGAYSNSYYISVDYDENNQPIGTLKGKTVQFHIYANEELITASEDDLQINLMQIQSGEYSNVVFKGDVLK